MGYSGKYSPIFDRHKKNGQGPALEFTPSYKRFYLTLLLCISFFFFASLKFYLTVRKKESEKRSAPDAVENQVRMRTKNSRENACIRMSSVKHQLRYMFS